jgi:DNA-binding transcriptional regulator YhcF (GntR family)
MVGSGRLRCSSFLELPIISLAVCSCDNQCYNRLVRMVDLDPTSTLPPYEQVRSQMAEAIGRGEILPAERLPTVRQLAGHLGLAVNTVAKAYRELEQAGLVETRGRQGTVVASQPSKERRLATQAARQFLARMKSLGIGEAETLAILARELTEERQPTTGAGPAE